VTERRLDVFLDALRVAELVDVDGIWRLTYDSAWCARKDSIPLSPHLPLSTAPIIDSATLRPVQWFFDNLLPEEALRARMAREARVGEPDGFGLLEAYGAESAGALTLLKPGEPFPAGALIPLDERGLLERIRSLPRETLPHRAPKKMSLAGAQNKLAVVLREGEVFEPQGSTASTHILKPNHPDADVYPHSAVNEWFTMALAARLELDVPTVGHRHVPAHESAEGHEAIYVVRRFDRSERDDNVRRLHAIDACQALNLDRAYKYRQMTVESLIALANLARSRAATRIRLFRWTVFNVMVANADAHLKNVSFLATPGGYELSPHYDLVSTGCFDAHANPAQWRDIPMSLRLPGAENFGQASAASLLQFAQALLLRPQVAARLVEGMRSRVITAADSLVAEYEARELPASAAILRAGELRVLRQIRHVVIAEMARQLAPS
jgi:serine/threonine-protein kinase HipA